MKTAIEVLDAFENIRRAQRAGVYAPHKPLLILLALARVQRGEPLRISANVTADFGIVTGLRSVLGCAEKIVGMRSS